MDQQTFETWMENVVPQMVQLSPQQTETFFTQFWEHCTGEQRRFLEKEFSGLLKKDLMTLPDLIVDKILEKLNLSTILNLRLVCQSWKKKMEEALTFWKFQCQRCLFLSAEDERKLGLVPYSFQFFVQSQRVLAGVTEGTGHYVRSQVIQGVPPNLPNKVPHLLCYSPDSSIIVAGALDMHLRAMEAETKRLLWVHESNVPSCLRIAGDMVLAGNHFGQVSVLSLKGRVLERRFQCGPCSVTMLDVHPSGRFMIVATADGLLHLVDDDLEVYNVAVHLKALTPVSSVREVFFLPDRALKDGELAVCVCTEYWRCVAVLGVRGQVLHEDKHKFSHSVCSLCHHVSKSNVLYILPSDDSGDRFPSVPRTLTKHTFRISSAGVSTKVEETAMCQNLSTWNSGDVLLLAAGRHLGLAVFGDSVGVFRMAGGTVVFSFPHFLDGERASRLAHQAATGRVLTALMDWLDGMTPFSMQAHNPVLFFSSQASCPEDSPVIKTLLWSDIWGSYSWPEVSSEDFDAGHDSDKTSRDDAACAERGPEGACWDNGDMDKGSDGSPRGDMDKGSDGSPRGDMDKGSDGSPRGDMDKGSDGSPRGDMDKGSDGSPRGDMDKCSDGSPRSDMDKGSDGSPRSDMDKGSDGSPRGDMDKGSDGSPRGDMDKGSDGSPRGDMDKGSDGSPRGDMDKGSDGSPRGDMDKGSDGSPRGDMDKGSDGSPRGDMDKGSDGSPRGDMDKGSDGSPRGDMDKGSDGSPRGDMDKGSDGSPRGDMDKGSDGSPRGDMDKGSDGSPRALFSHYKSCSPLGVWRNAALFEQKMRRKKYPSSCDLWQS
ncbi:hypothetical protein ACOMHN_004923 [Nucella lapillus]